MLNVNVSYRKIRERLFIAFLRGVIVCLLLTFALNRADAQTDLAGVHFWPEQMLPTNGQIILWSASSTARQTLQPIVSGSAVLASADDTVQLTILIPDSGMAGHSRSAVRVLRLIPQRSLLPNTAWQLLLRDAQGRLTACDQLWRTSAQADSLPPEWHGGPAAIGGCDRPGESRYAYVAIPVEEPVLTLARISWADPDGEQQSALLPFRSYPEIIEQFSGALLISDDVVLQMNPAMNGNAISVEHHRIIPVGQGIYGGDLQLQSGTEYSVEFLLVDSAGNHSAVRQNGRITVPNILQAHSPARATAGGPTPGSEEKQQTPVTSGLPAIPVPLFRNSPEADEAGK